MISFILPTRDRPERLRATLDAIASLGDFSGLGGAEVLIADNASTPPASAPQVLSSGVPVRIIRRERNEGTAARNVAAWNADPTSRWLVMLDDDSHPLDAGLVDALRQAPGDVGAVAAEILLPAPTDHPRHESGGLPEVFIGCGVALRRDAFLKVGGYDPGFDYYAEEYDLSAKLLLAGYRIVLDRRFRVMHHKVTQHRRFGRIIRRLVRNNGWVAQRYAPEPFRAAELHETIARYARIAWKERAPIGYALGLSELAFTLSAQTRSPMPESLFDRFTGLEHARRGLLAAHQAAPLGRVSIVAEGKNAWAVRRALDELAIPTTPDPAAADALVVGTLSPGPLLDALRMTPGTTPGISPRLVAPWAGVLDLQPSYGSSTPDARPTAGVLASWSAAA